MEGQPVQGAAWRPGVATRAGTRGHSESACVLSDYTRRATKGYLCFMALADGFGGEGRGDVASRLAVDALHAAMDPNRFDGEDDFRRSAEGALSEAVESANALVLQAGSAPDKTGLGTVITCAAVDSENAFLAHVGNARAYLLTARGTRQVTSDHVEPVEGRRTRLTSALGIDARVDADILRVPLRPGEVIFLCSHALYSALSIEQVSATLASTPDLQAACDAVVDAAVARGPVADVSIVAWRVPGDMPVAAEEAPEAAPPSPPPDKKRRRWLVALVVLLIIACIAAAGLGVAFILLKDRSPTKKAGTTAVQPASARFAAGEVLTVDTAGKPDACYLADYPGGPQQTRLYDGWKVKVISARFAEGEQWYRVEVVEGGLDVAGKRGYVQESFLAE
jgi:serine/threonine protein phosphatase PrpC